MSKFYLQTSTRVSGLTFNAFWAKANPAYGAMVDPGPQMNYVRAPRTRFGDKVSANRVVEAVGLPLEKIRDIRNRLPGITVNDIFLSVCGGALRRYLDAKGELPADSLRALMPIALRAAGAEAAKGGNDIGGAPVPLRTDIADPVERVRAVHDDAGEAKDSADVLGRDAIKSIYNEFPFAISNFVIENFILSQVNCTVSNVRGPDVPMYVAGARLVHAYPVSIPLNGVGVNFTGFSYNGVLWICAVSCRNMVPDPANLADALSASFEDLAAATGCVGPDAAKPKAVRTPRQTSTAKSRPPAKTRARTKSSPPKA